MIILILIKVKLNDVEIESGIESDSSGDQQQSPDSIKPSAKPRIICAPKFDYKLSSPLG